MGLVKEIPQEPLKGQTWDYLGASGNGGPEGSSGYVELTTRTKG